MRSPQPSGRRGGPGVAALELADRIPIDVESAGQDPIERFGVTAGTYGPCVADRGDGVNVVFPAPLTHLAQAVLSDAGRQLLRLPLGLAERARGPLARSPRDWSAWDLRAELRPDDLHARRRQAASVTTAPDGTANR